MLCKARWLHAARASRTSGRIYSNQFFVGKKQSTDHVSRNAGLQQQVSAHFTRSLSTAVSEVHLCTGKICDDNLHVVKVDADIMGSILDILFNGFDDIDWDIVDDIIDSSPGTLATNDIDFTTRWDEVRTYVLPLDPTLHVGHDEWREKGILRQYFEAAANSLLEKKSAFCRPES